jgi:hypothetical protein
MTYLICLLWIEYNFLDSIVSFERDCFANFSLVKSSCVILTFSNTSNI